MSQGDFVRYILVPSGLVSLCINLFLGIFVYLKNRHSALNRFFAIFAVSVGCWSVGSSLVNIIPNASKALFVLRLCYISAAFLPTFFLHFALILTRRISTTPYLKVAYAVSGMLALLTFTHLFIPRLRAIEPFGFRISDPGPAYYVFFIFFAICLTAGLWLMYQRIGATTGKERLQVQYIFLSHLIALSAGLQYFSCVFRLVKFPPVDDYILVIYFLVFAYAIARHQLLDIEIVIRRSLVYSLLIACITAIYLVMVLIMEHWFQGFFGYRSIVATLLVAFLIALGFNPLRSRIQALVDRALFQATPVELAAQRERLLSEVRKGEQQKAVATLAAGLAHEIKNPLAAIKTFMEYLPEKQADPAFLAKFHRIVGQEVDKIQEIVHNLLTFAKPVPPKQETIAASELIQETLGLLGGDCMKRQVTVEASAHPECCLRGDRTQLKQVLLNLCLNSLEAMEATGSGRLKVSAARLDGHIILSVEDTGPGIAPKDLPHIYEPFFSTKERGTGLGLSVVKSIIEQHGGRVAITSTPGQGTRVTLHLPVSTTS